MIFDFQIKKYRKEDNWKDGETGDVYEKDFTIKIEADNLKEAYIKFWKQYCSIPNFEYNHNSTFVQNGNFIFCARTENEYEEYPNEEELKIWKQCNINLFAATFEIRIPGQNLKTLDLKLA